MIRPPPTSTLFPYTTLFRSSRSRCSWASTCATSARAASVKSPLSACSCCSARSEEHTSELQSRENLVCRLLLEKKKTHSRPREPSAQICTTFRPGEIGEHHA